MQQDPLCTWFVTQGYEVRPHYWCATRLQIGWQFSSRGCQLSWRCDGERVWIVMFRRSEARAGLTNAFAALYVLAEAVRQALGPAYRLYGNVDTMRDSSLSAERLRQFYLRWGEASEPEPGWFEIPAAAVRPMRMVRSDKNAPVADRVHGGN